MTFHKSSFEAIDEAGSDSGLAKQLVLLNAVTKQECNQAERLIQSRLQAAIASLQQSSTAIRMMLSAQHPSDRESASGIKLQRELEALLANSTHLSCTANMMQTDFSTSRRTCEQRTDSSISKVVDAVKQHRSTVQDNAIAMTLAALDKARSPSPWTHASRSADRRPREAMPIHSSAMIGSRSATLQRKVFRCRAQLRLADGNSVDVRTVDITTGGISVMSQQGFTAGAVCSLVFELPVKGALQFLTASVKIVYATPVCSEGTRLGLRFVTADPVRTQLINGLH